MHKAVANDEHRKVPSAIGHLRRLGAWLATGPRIAAIAIATLLKQDICTTQAAATRVQISPGKTIPPGELAHGFGFESANTPIAGRLSVLVGDAVNGIRSC